MNFFVTSFFGEVMLMLPLQTPKIPKKTSFILYGCRRLLRYVIDYTVDAFNLVYYPV